MLLVLRFLLLSLFAARGLIGAKRRLYFTEIGIGTPAKSFYVQVDTGSDLLWVNCVSCDTCPRKSGLGVTHHLTLRALIRCFFPFRAVPFLNPDHRTRWLAD
jgi:hypothetical protein